MKANTREHTVALCTKCNRRAAITQHRQDIGGEIERTFLRCEKCGHEATICYTDPAIRAALKEQKARYKAGDRSAIQTGAEKLQAMMDALQAQVEGAADAPG